MTTGGGSFWTSGAVPLIEPEFLSSIIAAASDLALVVSSDKTILSVVPNQSDESFGNLKHWERRPIAEFLTSESQVKFDALHADYMSGSEQTKPIELNHVDNASWQYPVRYTFHRFGNDDSVLMLGRDLRPIAETQQQLVQAQIALEQGYEARREYDTRFRVILNNVKDAVVFVSVQTGRIEDVNEEAAQLLGLRADALIGTSFASLFVDRSAAEFTESLMNATLADGAGPTKARATRTGQSLSISPNVFRAGGQRSLMCRLEAPSADSGASEKPAGLAAGLYRSCSDAILFVDSKGQVLSVNDSVLDLIGAAHPNDIVGKSLADILSRGQIDLNVLLEHAQRSGHMRVYATKLIDSLGKKHSVEASATWLEDDQTPAVGIILRDVDRLEPVRGQAGVATNPLTDPNRNVMDLVGSASLKEIVAETTDVVEKMCIETAVGLTRNNRVAAAEMLGLSRQSLYVKLRKYGLLSKNG
ncbi:MAG: transcriptional regulator PpsR [Pseudomonadota bacterium]